jgi:hypothetical protein
MPPFFPLQKQKTGNLSYPEIRLFIYELQPMSYACPVKYIEDMEQSGFNRGAGTFGA